MTNYEELNKKLDATIEELYDCNYRYISDEFGVDIELVREVGQGLLTAGFEGMTLINKVRYIIKSCYDSGANNSETWNEYNEFIDSVSKFDRELDDMCNTCQIDSVELQVLDKVRKLFDTHVKL